MAMKLEIDFELRTVTIPWDVTLGELVRKMKKMHLKWKEFSVIVTPMTVTTFPTDNNQWTYCGGLPDERVADLTYGTSIN
jgi:hypothetical protein